MKHLRNKTAYASDEEIIEKIINGETALFELLIRRYNSLLYKIARSYGLNHQDTEDMMQESHFTAYTMLRDFRKESSYKTWLTKIHLNKCYHKMNYKNLKYEQSGIEDVNNETAPAGSFSKDDAEKLVLNRELAKVLELSLQRLPLVYRSVFVLREIEGFSVAETAALLEITTINVKVRLNRAKALLQKQLEKYYSSIEIYEFNLIYCDELVKNIFIKIESLNDPLQL